MIYLRIISSLLRPNHDRCRKIIWVSSLFIVLLATRCARALLVGQSYQKQQVSPCQLRCRSLLRSTYNENVDRDHFLKSCTAGIISSYGAWVQRPEWSCALETSDDANAAAGKTEEETTSTAYEIKPDATKSLSPSLLPLNENDLILRLGLDGKDSLREGALWIGEHHNAQSDHTLLTSLIQQLHEVRQTHSKKDEEPSSMALGLEQVQVQFQKDLDNYTAGKTSADELKEAVQWNTRWVWPFEVYRPVFEKAKELGIPLIALNVDSEDLAEVEKGGYPNLERSKLKKYIKDPRGFAEFSQHEDFREYVSYVIEPSYDLHERLGLLRNTISGQQLEEPMTFRNFLSGRTLWDEGMASAAFQWNLAHPGGLMVGLVGADHVKFGKGITGRYKRMIDKACASASSSAPSETLSDNGVGGTKRSKLSCTSLILNPSLVDTRPSGSLLNVEGAGRSDLPDTITLQLRYLKDGVDRTSSTERSKPENTGGVLPFSDYILIGDSI